MTSSHDDAGYYGEELGLPPEGPGSLAPFSLRLLALFIDWGIALLLSLLFIGAPAGDPGSEPQVAFSLGTLGIFAVLQILGGGLFGVTLGKRLVRIQVVHGTAAPGMARMALRTLLLLLVIPPVAISRDGRGAHDRIAKTVQLRM